MERDPSASAVLATHGVILARGGRAFAALPDLGLARGRSVALLGASGSGKTTALMALAGIRAPHSGEIAVGDVRAVGLVRRRRATASAAAASAWSSSPSISSMR